MTEPSHDDFIEDVLAAAKAHGQISEPDHEVGDLQDVLRACWGIMTPEQRTRIAQMANASIEELYSPGVGDADPC